jgi:Ca-activated chloride channel family protein
VVVLGETVQGRHTANGRNIGGRSLRGPLALGVVVALVALTVVAVRVVAADANGCSTGVRLNIAANPDIYPSVREAATRWVATNPKVDNQCVRVQVTSTPAADVANALAVRAGAGAFINVAAKPMATPPDDQVPAVWLPDSISWIGRVQAVNRDAFEDDIPSVAMSPVVLGMPETLARTLEAGRPHKLGTDEIATLLQRALRDKDKNFQLGVAEPRRDSASLAGAILLRDAIATSPAQLPQLVAAYRTISLVPDQTAVLSSFGTRQTMAPLTEQAVLSYDANSPQSPLAAVPLESAPALDYPYATVAGKPRAVAEAADLFRKALISRSYRDIFAKAAFRDPDGGVNPGFPIGHGATAETAIGNPLTDTKKIADVLAIWTGSKIASRIVTLTDVTSVMAQPVAPGGPSRMQIVQKAQVDGLKLFTDDSEMSVWGFAAGLPGGKDYREMVPMGALGPAQRNKINTTIAANQPLPIPTRGLYESILAAYKAVKNGWEDGKSNTVLVFTAGGNTKPDGLSLDDVNLELERLTDPTKPIRVVLLGFGPDVNLDELNSIAKTTGGKAFKVERPEDIGGVFLQALLRN